MCVCVCLLEAMGTSVCVEFSDDNYLGLFVHDVND